MAVAAVQEIQNQPPPPAPHQYVFAVHQVQLLPQPHPQPQAYHIDVPLMEFILPIPQFHQAQFTASVQVPLEPTEPIPPHPPAPQFPQAQFQPLLPCDGDVDGVFQANQVHPVPLHHPEPQVLPHTSVFHQPEPQPHQVGVNVQNILSHHFAHHLEPEVHPHHRAPTITVLAPADIESAELYRYHPAPHPPP